MRRILTILFCLSLLSLPMNANAQVAGAAVSLECSETYMPTDPLAAGNESFECIATNPTTYNETISIQVTGDGLEVNAPAYINVSAGENVTFNVSVAWDAGVDPDTVRSITTTATVTTMNDVPPPNSASSSVNTLFDFGHNYSANGCTTEATTTAQYIQFQIGELHPVEGESMIHAGNFTVELNYSAAPIHAENFALLSLMGCYDEVPIHRIISDFMMQGGDFTNGDGTGGHAAKFVGRCNGQPASSPSECSESSYTIPDEADNGLEHLPYALSMAKTSAPHTGGSQFFIVDPDAVGADGTAGTPHLNGVHTVFGKVIDGYNIIDGITSYCERGCYYDNPELIYIERAIIQSNVDYDTDSDGVNNDADNCPNDANPNQEDFDNDTMGDACDDDNDNDLVNNSDDAFPFDVTEHSDIDGDGIGDNADADDDNDGLNDTDDAFDNDANETTDTDGDGIGNNADADDDGDGIVDESDNCPLVANADQADADNDGIGTACDADETEEETPTVPAISLAATGLIVLLASIITRRD